MDDKTTAVMLGALTKIQQSLTVISERLDHNDVLIATMMAWWTEPIDSTIETERDRLHRAAEASMLPPGADVP